jgi:hypothetical protein
MGLNRSARIRSWVARAAAVAAAGMAAAPRVLAQGCAMCYADAAAQGPRARQSLDFAILTLLVPSVLLFAGVLFAAFRRRERDLARTEDPGPSQTAALRNRLPSPDAVLTPDATSPLL